MDKLIGITSDDENVGNHSLGSDEEFFGGKSTTFKDSDEEMSDEEEDERQTKTQGKAKKTTFDAFGADESDDNDDYDNDNLDSTSSTESLVAKKKTTGKETEEMQNVNELYRKSKLQAHKDKKPKGKTGVVYLSKIPPYMKPIKMRQILSRFGEVDRLFLKKESTQKHQARVKNGGNKKTSYEEGWAEFIRKKDAKLAADTLNGNTLGGRKGSFYYDDVMNVKYLSGFKWNDLTEQISKENEIRQSKLQMEISQARKLNKTFITNVQKSKMIENIKKKKGVKEAESGEKDDEVRRTFNQRSVTTARADGPEKHKKKENQSQSIVNSIF